MRTNKSSGAGQSGGPRRNVSRPDPEVLAGLSGVITGLTPQQKNPQRFSVYLDGEFVLGLYGETIVLSGLKKGLKVTGEQLLRALRMDDGKRAWDAALLLLSAAPHSCREVERRLAPRYGPEAAAEVVERLKAGGWLNDAEFAQAYIRSHGDYGARRLAAELARKGVARDVAQRAVASALGAESHVEQARAAAAKRLARMPGVDRDTAQRRLSGFLARRGYDFECIMGALSPLLADQPRAPRPERTSAGLSRLGSGRSGLGRRAGLGRRKRPPDSEDFGGDE